MCKALVGQRPLGILAVSSSYHDRIFSKLLLFSTKKAVGETKEPDNFSQDCREISFYKRHSFSVAEETRHLT